MSLWKRVLFLICVAVASAQGAFHHENVFRLPNAQVLAIQHETLSHGHTLRVVVNEGESKAIKYVFLSSSKKLHQLINPPTSEPVSINLPPLPQGDWNEAYMQQDSYTGIYHISNTTRTIHSETLEPWHHRKIDYLEFVTVTTLQHDRLQVVTHPAFSNPVLIKISSFPWETLSLEREVAVYRLLYGAGVTPKFLGHVTESGRVIGFITEYIEEVPLVRCRNMQRCLTALHKVHKRGIAHGDAHDGNCLIRKDGSAVLIDFELSVENGSYDDFERDLDIMDRCLQVAVDKSCGADIET